MAAAIAHNPSSNFLERVWQLPLVTAAVDYTSTHYQQVREYNPVVKQLMTTAEKSLSYAAENAKPVVEKFNKPIQMADGIACRTLTIVEQKVPMLTKTPDQISEEAKQVYARNVALIKNGSTELLTTVKGYGEDKAQRFLQTSYGQRVASQLENLADKAGWYLDNNVPQSEGGKYPAQPVSGVKPGQTTEKVLLLTNKIQQLVLLHAQARLTYLQRVLQAVTNLKERSAQQLSSARDRTAEVLQHVKKTANSGQERAVNVYKELKSRTEREGTLEHRLIATAQHASNNVAAILKGISDTVKLPPVVQTTVQKTRDNLVQLQQALANMKVMEIPSSLLGQLRDQVASIQNYIASINSGRPQSTEMTTAAVQSSPKTSGPVKPAKMSSPRKEKPQHHQN
jgi:perilipin-2